MEKTALARKMLLDALGSKDDPAARYVLLSRASELSSEVGDLATSGSSGHRVNRVKNKI